MLDAFQGVLARGLAQIEVGHEDDLVAMIREPQNLAVGRHDLRIAGRPPAPALAAGGVGEDVVDRVFERPHRDAVLAPALAARDRERVEPRIGMKQHPGSSHHGQPHQFRITPLVANDRGRRHAIEFE